MKSALRLTSCSGRGWPAAWGLSPAIVAPLLGPVCLLVIFAGVLSGRDRLAFRDVGYFYTPLYQFVAEQCHAQSWGALGQAIWNPSDQTGMPLAGETTTAVFYPFRMLVYAPSWSAETAMGVYVVLHLIIASLTAYFAARRYRLDPWSAAVAGVVYPFSGMVLFLATNPPFLVAAAWLPLLLTPLIHWPTTLQISGVGRRNGSTREPALIPWRRAVVVPAVAMSLILLGGDPPTALHAMILAVIVQASQLALECWRGRRPPHELVRISLAILVQMTAVVVLASALAAPQLAASLAWSARSDRVQDAEVPEISKVRAQAYAFSVPPWRGAELLAPNLYGSPWPVNTRWDRLVFDGGRARPETALWTPSLYSGMLLPVLLVLGWSRRKPFFKSGLSRGGLAMLIVFTVSMAAALGAYGPVYRGLHEFLPGYDSLRYPAKWLPMAAFALAICSARAVRWHSVTRRRQESVASPHAPAVHAHRIAWTLWTLGVIVVSVGTAVMISRLQGRVSDPFWGPFVATLATRGFLVSMACALVLILLIARARRPWWWLVLVALDLSVAHHRLVPTIDRAAESQLLAGEQRVVSSIRWMRVNQEGGFPVQWREQSDRDRMLTVEAGLRLANFGRWHLEHGDAVLNNLVSIGSRELAEFWHYAKAMDRADGSLPEQHWRGWYRLLGVGGLLRCRGGDVVVSAATLQRALPVVTQERLPGADEIAPSQLSIRRQVQPIGEDRVVAWRELLLAYADERAEVPARVPLRIIRRLARATGAGRANVSELPPPAGTSEVGGRHQLSTRPPRPAAGRPSQEEREEGSSSTGLVLLSRHVYQDGNWSAVLRPLDRDAAPLAAEVFPVDFLSQGVLCPPGRWRIDFIYAPWWHRPMLLLAAFGWGGVFGAFLLRRTRIVARLRSPPDTRRR